MKRLAQWLHELFLKMAPKGVLAFLYLWHRTKPDCRVALVEEFFFNPRAYRHRLLVELEFDNELRRRWLDEK